MGRFFKYYDSNRIYTRNCKQVSRLEIKRGKFKVLKLGFFNYKLKGCGPRSWSQLVLFTEIFSNRPNVFVAFSLLDIVNNKESDFRASCAASEITTSSFKMTFNTWSDSIVWSLQANWIAYDKELCSEPGL